MNTAATPLGDHSALPELHEAMLDQETAERLFRDIQICTQVLEVLPKFRNRAYVSPTAVTVEQGRHLLESQEAIALQIRYRYEGHEWWDTLMLRPSGYRLVRIRHES